MAKASASSESIIVLLPNETAARVKEIASAEGRSWSAVIRRMVQQAVARRGKKSS
jgi:predicted transcriptional regulator